MPWLLLATFGANWWSPVWAVEQCDPIKEGHLTQFLDLLANLYLYLYLHLGRSSVGATCLLMFPVTTYGAGLLPLLWAFLRLMASLPATEALDLAWVAIHEDRHFYRSVDTGNKWRWFGGYMGRGREGSLQLCYDKDLQTDFYLFYSVY